VPFIIMQQVQPAFIIIVMQSQQAWIISQQRASPLVQVTQQPSLVISTLHMPIVRLQQQTVIPFIIMQQLTIPPAIMLQRFCIMLQAVGSSHRQVIFMPPAHFSNFMVQRGTIIQFAFAGIPVGVPTGIPVPIAPPPGMVMPARSIIVILDMSHPPFLAAPPAALIIPRPIADQWC
jgi:hypothetical protein